MWLGGFVPVFPGFFETVRTGVEGFFCSLCRAGFVPQLGEQAGRRSLGCRSFAAALLGCAVSPFEITGFCCAELRCGLRRRTRDAFAEPPPVSAAAWPRVGLRGNPGAIVARRNPTLMVIAGA